MCRGGVHICRLKRTAVRFPLLFSVDLNFALYKYKYRILIPFCLLNHPSRRPVLTRGAASYPPGLAALSCALTSLRGLRLARSPLRYRLARSPLRYRLASPPPRSEPRLLSCPHAPRLRSPRPSLLLPDGVSLSEPRSVRADVIPGSERHVTPATRQRGGGARRVDRGEEHRPPFGRAAERARSAARASPGHPLRMALSPPRPIFFLIFNRCTPLKNANIFLCLKTYLTLIKTGGGSFDYIFIKFAPQYLTKLA